MFYVDQNQKANFTMPYEFPLAVHESYLKDKPLGFNDWHWHEEIQFSYILSGEMILSCMSKDFLLTAGDGIFINSNCAHMSRPTGPESARYLSVNIQPSLLTLFHGSVVEQKYFLPYANHPKLQVIAFSAKQPEQKQFIEDLIQMFRLIDRAEFGYELETYGQLFHIWKQLLIMARTTSLPGVRLERQEAHAMMQYIQEHYMEPIRLEDLARHVHLSKGECSRIFKATYHTSIMAHVIDCRISKSIPLLSGTSLSVGEIALQCGFNSASYFTKAFREKVGIAPLQYRKK